MAGCAMMVAVVLCAAESLRGAPAKEPAKKPMRVLFVGNSYTYGHKLPQVVASLAAADKDVRPMEVKMVASGGKNLVWHAKNKATLDAIAAGWDYVVLQDQSLTPTLMPQRSMEGARVLDAAVGKAGGKTMFFMTWRRRPTPELLKKYPDMHNRNSRTYMSMGRELKAVVAPVGYAWKTAYDENPKRPLYARDNSHSAPMGAYLSACVFYSTIYNKSAVGLPAKVVLSGSGKKKSALSVPQAEAKKLQTIAWKAVQQARKELGVKPASRPAKKTLKM